MSTPIQLWHCQGARSLRPLWTLEEMGLDYDLTVLPFPPRYLQPEYLETNPLGTVPYFTHGNVRMTESTAICQYLVDRWAYDDLRVQPEHPEYGNYLNWLHQSDATLTFPLTLVLRYEQLEPEERRLPQVAEAYRRWFLARLKWLDQHLQSHRFLCDDRFTIADISVGYALFLGNTVGVAGSYQPQTQEYLTRLSERPAFQRADARR
jgi:glutathione S-transferase